jgi:hypothetical protein
MAYPYFNNLAPGPDPYPLSKKEECMNHGRGERTDHLPIFYKKTVQALLCRNLNVKSATLLNATSSRRIHLQDDIVTGFVHVSQIILKLSSIYISSILNTTSCLKQIVALIMLSYAKMHTQDVL